jgi:hypothetical protein
MKKLKEKPLKVDMPANDLLKLMATTKPLKKEPKKVILPNTSKILEQLSYRGKK